MGHRYAVTYVPTVNNEDTMSQFRGRNTINAGERFYTVCHLTKIRGETI
jgi:hypothetical protein